MKQFDKAIFFLLLVSICSYSFGDAITFWGTKSETWKLLDSNAKTFYIQGAFDSLIFSDLKIHDTHLSVKLSHKEYINGLDTLYSDYRNSQIPVLFLLRIVTLEASGMDKDTVEKELVQYRKQAAEL